MKRKMFSRKPKQNNDLNIGGNNQTNISPQHQNNRQAYNNRSNQYHGQNRHGGNNRHRFGGYHQSKPFIPHVPFDFINAEHAFPRLIVKPETQNDDKLLNEALIKRNQDLTPQSNDQTLLSNLLTKIQTALDNLILAPGDFDACQIDEIKQVGSFKTGTLLVSSCKLIGDLCVILKTLPTKEAVNRLAHKIFTDIKAANQIDFKESHLSVNEKGFEIYVNEGHIDIAVQVLVSTQQQNIRRLDPNLHLDYRHCQTSLLAIKHARWFEENSSHSTVKVLIRILKDIKNRFDGLTALNPWIIDLLAHYCVMTNPKREALPLIVAFKRVFQLISAGFFLPGSAGIIDPCEQSVVRVHTTMSLEQQDIVCYTCQTLLRVLSHGGFKQILGFEGNSTIATSPSVWGGVMVIPSFKAYESNKDGIDNLASLLKESDQSNNTAVEPQFQEPEPATQETADLITNSKMEAS